MPGIKHANVEAPGGELTSAEWNAEHTIEDGSIATAALVANAVTQIQSVTDDTFRSTTSGTYEDLTGMTVTITTVGGPVLIFFRTVLDGAGTNMAYKLRILEDDVELCNIEGALDGAWNDVAQAILFWTKTPSAAEHTYHIEWQTSAGTLYAQKGDRILMVIELKR